MCVSPEVNQFNVKKAIEAPNYRAKSKMGLFSPFILEVVSQRPAMVTWSVYCYYLSPARLESA